MNPPWTTASKRSCVKRQMPWRWMEGRCTLRGCVAWFRSWQSSMMKLNVVILEIPPPPLTMLLPW
uniref:Uncharacterized protein n=1 Tax=Anguilla anguilla TaxID=7936 RepID=A0A0E9UDG6_ANGAN